MHTRGNVVGTARVVIVVPRTMPRGKVFHLNVSGNTGPFSSLAVFLDVKPCAAMVLTERKRQQALGTGTIGKQHRFAKTFEPLPGSPGVRYVCAYLYAGNGAATPQLRASKRYTVI